MLRDTLIAIGMFAACAASVGVILLIFWPALRGSEH